MKTNIAIPVRLLGSRNENKKNKLQILSKNLKIILVLAFTAILSSCSKDDEPTPVVVTKNNYRLIKAESENATYQYDAKGRVNKLYDFNDIPRKTFVYNSDNKLEKIIDVALSNPNEINTIFFTYNNTSGSVMNGKLENKTTIVTYVNRPNEERFRRNYEHTSLGVLDGSLMFQYNPLTFEYENPTNIHTYQFDYRGLLTRFKIGSTYLLDYSYDDNGNLVEEIKYNNYLRYKTIYTYDNKKNPIHNLVPKSDIEIVTSPNNVTGYTRTNYNPDGTVANTVTEGGVKIPGIQIVNYTYEYNDGGYPIKQFTPTGTNSFTYETYSGN